MRTLLPFFLLAGSLHAADWPQFRGPTADGVTPDSHLPLTWSEKENLVWRTELPGPGSSSPIISGDKVFLTSYSGYGIDVKDPGDMAKLKRHAICLDKKTGKILWNHEITTDLPNKPYTGTYITTHGYASSSPVTDGNAVFFFMANAGVYAYTVNGKAIWNVSVGEMAHDWGRRFVAHSLRRIAHCECRARKQSTARSRSQERQDSVERHRLSRFLEHAHRREGGWTR
ncbi:MAG: PQQ-binding-like beta-propeller repeat protein [Verrucomicrobiales bacterium]